jgi:hypothetical protein
MMIAEVKFEVEIPEEVNANEHHVREWVEFNIGFIPHISSSNPLSEYEIDPSDNESIQIKINTK